MLLQSAYSSGRQRTAWKLKTHHNIHKNAAYGVGEANNSGHWFAALSKCGLFFSECTK